MFWTVRINRKPLLLSVGILIGSLALCFAANGYRAASVIQAETPLDPQQATPQHTAYLTFDDGPSAVTTRILAVLDELGVKATFFVIGRTNQADVATLKQIRDKGHSIGLHSYSHRYQEIYRDPDSYLADFNAIEDWVYSITQEPIRIFRFPGGSNNATASQKVMDEIATEMTRRGYVYYDWNVIAQDDRKEAYPADVLFRNVKKSAEGKLDRDLILLFHDNATRKTTPDVLPQVVSYFRGQGYVFDRITPETPPIQFRKPQKKK